MNLKASISLAPQAEQDLISIWQYSNSNWGEDKADSYLDQLHSGIKLLSEQPLMGLDYSHVRIGYRKVQIAKHNIFYTLDETELLIVRVLHGAVDAENQLG